MRTEQIRPDNATLAGYLRSARELLADPARWAPEHKRPEWWWRQAHARSAKGYRREPHSEDAVCWSIEGAIERQFGGHDEWKKIHDYDKRHTIRRAWLARVDSAKRAVRHAIAMSEDPGVIRAVSDHMGRISIDAWATWKTHAEVLDVLDMAIRMADG